MTGRKGSLCRAEASSGLEHEAVCLSRQAGKEDDGCEAVGKANLDSALGV